MGQFLYYLPQEKREVLSNDELKATRPELFDLVGDAGFGCVRTGSGPDGKGGLLIKTERPRPTETAPQPLRFLPEKQTWEQSDLGYWVGLDSEFPPGSSDLIRPNHIPGYPVELGNEKFWLIPTYRRSDGETDLPVTLRRNPDGTLRKKVCPKFREFEEIGNRIFADWKWIHDWIDEGEEEPEHLTLEEQFEIACQAISLNYRMREEEIGLLELIVLSSSHFYNGLGKVLYALIDAPAIVQANLAMAAKKNSSGDSIQNDSDNSDSGPED